MLLEPKPHDTLSPTLELNKKQIAILILAALLIIGSGLFPPWHVRHFSAYLPSGPGSYIETEFHFFLHPDGTLALTTLLAEWFVILFPTAVILLLSRDRKP